MAQQHLEQVLTAAGLTEAQVKELAGLAADAADFKTDGYIAPIHTGVENKLINSPEFYAKINKESVPKEFLKTIETEQYGRAANIVRSTMLKAVGMTEKDFQDLGDEGKKIEVFTPKFVERLNKGDVSAKELQQKLMAANQEIEQLKGLEPELQKKYEGQFETRIAEYQLNGSALAHLASVQGLKAPADLVVDKLVSNLKGKYAFVIVNGVPEPRQLSNPQLKAMNAANTKALTFAEVMDQEIADRKLVEPKKTDKVNGTDTIDVDPDKKGGLKMHKGVSAKVQNRLEQDKKNAGASA